MHVLYEDAGKLKAETIFSEADTSLQVESASGKRSKIKRNAVLFTFERPSPDSLLPAAEALAATLDAGFLWECAPQQEFEAAALAEDYFGHAPDAVEKTATILALSAAPAYFHRRGKGAFRPAPPDILQAALAAIEKKRRQAELQEEWTESILGGTLPDALRPVAATFLDRPDKNTLEWKAFDAAVQRSDTSPERLLLTLGVWPHPLAMMRDRFLSAHFPRGTDWPPVELQDWGADLPQAEVEAYSLDDASTTEIDDALSVSIPGPGMVRVGIHIAVPALAVTRGSALDELARARMSTVYMPGDKIPMLSPELIAAFSLDEGQWRPTLSLYVTGRLEDGEILDTETRLERIRVTANLRHGQIGGLVTEDALADPDAPLPHGHWLRPLWQFAQALSAVRDRTRGKPENNDRIEYGFEIDGPPDDPDSIVRLVPRQRNAPLDRLVAEFMILANTQWGALLARHGVPGIYRSQQTGRTRMSTQALPHESIAVPQYIWSTSPLRRYVDLINQGQILAAAEHGVSARLAAPFKPKDADLYALIGAFDSQYTAWSEFQSSMERYWCIRWMRQQGLKEVRAHVLRENLVRLACAPFVTRINGLPEFERGHEVRLDILGYDEIGLEVEFRPRETG
ncbi:ribonuclease catalytic domain-containing protein [Castellaniella denitrificans]|uniref:RNB domain-containing ribonuclease n=1 Tax=Castellaniella denitrificans TaxID=56119 RepID=A0ABT4LZC6_9BURK|nr:ribonuclease catalytic domain-containing protein [Castellaniella denitrificans]MCZ4328418.1 RNB domain-containing ribonuclease [Castellaniella denitrificans]